jgi:hypothetical protein
LNGINPDKNPGTYKFKSDMAGKHGRDVHYVGRLDSHPGRIRVLCIELGDHLRAAYRTLKARHKKEHTATPEPKTSNQKPDECQAAALRSGSPVS